MVFAFEEGGTLVIHKTVEDATRAYEGIDVESGIIKFYREDGTYLWPVFSLPNRSGRFLGIFRWVKSGVYRLEPDSGESDDSIGVALHEAVVMEPNRWFQKIEQIKDALRQPGVRVDGPLGN